MEYSPPPLFKQGPSAFARLIFFVALALVLLIGDAHFKALEIARGIVGAALYPLQRAALVPRDILADAAQLTTSRITLHNQNQALTEQNLKLSLQANQAAALSAENAHLRALLNLSQHVSLQSTPAEIQYDTSDPFTQRVLINVGSQQNIQNGSPVVNQEGVVGQITRVFPMQSELTLLTDKDQAVPVESLRTGLRSIVYGSTNGGTLEMRYVPLSADVLVGDELVTSGLDGIYPPGLPVAKVVRVDKLADTAFAHIICTPIAVVRGAKQFLVLHYQSTTPPPPEEMRASAEPKKGKRSANRVTSKPAPKSAPNSAPKPAPKDGVGVKP